MIYPIESTESWTNKYGIHPKDGTCPKCSQKIIADKPFADGSLRGFISEDHGCGIEYCLITCYDTKNKIWELVDWASKQLEKGE